MADRNGRMRVVEWSGPGMIEATAKYTGAARTRLVCFAESVTDCRKHKLEALTLVSDTVSFL